VVDSKQSVVGLQEISWDITDLKRSEEQLRSLNASLEERVAERTRALREYAQRLEDKNEELDRFVYVASHDLQEPVRKLISFSQLLERDVDTDLNEKARRDLHYITDSARRMQQLVQDLLALSHADRSTMQQDWASLDDCAQRALDALAVRVEQTDASVVRETLPEVWGDHTMLTQLYQNLISNALKFIRPGNRPMVHLTAEREGDTWVLGVRDNGIGIEPQYATQIFAPFQRLHRRDQYEGTGIGLAICQTTVERHGGRIWVESTPGVGSQFKFTLPAAGPPTVESEVMAHACD
jgi:light-regulated signal transduction histidine kinase (bacteriophytochrome)